MTYSSYSTLNSLEEFSFIGGTTFEMDFVFYEDGVPLSLIGYAFVWKMSPYGNKSTTTLEKNGTVLPEDDTICRVTLDSIDTENLSGKFVHQISYSDLLGNNPKIPAQGNIIIIKKI